MPVYRVKLNYTMYGQPCMNRFFYFAEESPDASAEGMGRAFAASSILLAVRNLCTNDVQFNNIDIEDLTGLTGSYIVDLTGLEGGRVGDGISQFVTWTYQLVPAAARLFRKGRKALSGVDESLTVNGEPANASAELIINAFGIACQLVLGYLGVSYVPVLARLNDTGTRYIVTTIINAVYRRISTQSTRKRGSGASAVTSFIPDYAIPLTPTGDIDSSLMTDTFERALQKDDIITGEVEIQPLQLELL